MTDTTARADDVAPPENDPATQSAAPADQAAALAQEAADLKDRLLRTLAEMENLRKRTEREVADARAYAIASFARDVVSIGDNMRRALDTAGPDLQESSNDAIKALLEGLDLTERELLKALEKHGVKKLEPQGAKFDPHLHQAMYEVPDESVPAGTIVQVVQSGYTIGDRVLRPALVAVAKGGPKATPKATAGANSNVSESDATAKTD